MSQMAAFVGAAVGATLRSARSAAICGRSLSVSAPAAMRATAPVRVREASRNLGVLAILWSHALRLLFGRLPQRGAVCAVCSVLWELAVCFAGRLLGPSARLLLMRRQPRKYLLYAHPPGANVLCVCICGCHALFLCCLQMMEAMDDEARVTEDAKLFVGNLSWSTTDEVRWSCHCLGHLCVC